MIAIAKPLYVGVKKFDGQALLGKLGWLTGKIPESDLQLLEETLREPMEYIDNPMFHDVQSELDVESSFKVTDDVLRTEDGRQMTMVLFEETDRAISSFKPMTGEQEVRMFLKLNYARYRIFRVIKRIGQNLPTPDAVAELLKWRKAELLVRSQITQANIPLVISMAKRMKNSGVDFSDLVGEGSLALIRSANKFDCARGFKFSTYACRSILKSFARVALRANRYRSKFPVEFDPDYQKSDHLGQLREETRTRCLDRLYEILDGTKKVTHLNDIEKQILCARFGITETQERGRCMTLEEVGKQFNISKERVRQIQNRALKKLRSVLEELVLNG